MPAPSFAEIEAPSRADAARFFEAALGWTFAPWESEGDGVFDAGGFRVGLHEGAVPSLAAYFPVADIEAAVRAVREAGGEASEPSPPEPGFGRFARCTAPGGVPFGLHQPG
jgi:predicted enzyme related to lactoylglutathione lyase